MPYEFDDHVYVLLLFHDYLCRAVVYHVLCVSGLIVASVGCRNILYIPSVNMITMTK